MSSPAQTIVRVYGSPEAPHERTIVDAARAVAYGVCSDPAVLKAIGDLLESLRGEGDTVANAERELVRVWNLTKGIV